MVLLISDAWKFLKDPGGCVDFQRLGWSIFYPMSLVLALPRGVSFSTFLTELFCWIKASEICQRRASQIRGSLFPREDAWLARAHATHIPELHRNVGPQQMPVHTLYLLCMKAVLKVHLFEGQVSWLFFFFITFYPFPIIVLLLFLLLSLKAMNRNWCRWSSVVKALGKWPLILKEATSSLGTYIQNLLM